MNGRFKEFFSLQVLNDVILVMCTGIMLYIIDKQN